MHSSKYIFIIFLMFCKPSTQDKVNVSLYYESLCPFCREFVTEQLYPAYQKIKNFLILDLVPYGKANQTKVNENWEFRCQHGPKECQGNKIQACVLNKWNENDEKVTFVNCMMTSNDPGSIENARKCASDKWPQIQDCVQKVEGDVFLARYGDITHALNPKLKYVPHIIFNGVFNETVEDLAREDFFKTVCSLFDVKPVVCNNK